MKRASRRAKRSGTGSEARSSLVHFLIVVLSEGSLKSHGVLEELRTAQIFSLDQVKVLPIRIDPVSYGTIPVYLRSRHILDFVGWEDKKVFNARVAKLAADIVSLWEAGEVPT